MKRTILVLLAVMLLSTGVAFGVARWLRCRSCPAPATPAAAVHDAAWLTGELRLNPEQAARVRDLEKQYREQLAAVCAQHCGARADLAAALTQTSPDRGKLNVCLERMCAAETASERATLEHILQVRALLTPEQQARYSATVAGQMKGACPMRVHQP